MNIICQLCTAVKLQALHYAQCQQYVKNAVSSSLSITVSNSRMINDQWTVNWRGCARMCSWPNMKCCTEVFLEGLRNITKTIASRASLFQDVSLGPSIHEAGESCIQPWHFITWRIHTVFVVLGSMFGCWPTHICHIYQHCPVSGDCIHFSSSVCIPRHGLLGYQKQGRSKEYNWAPGDKTLLWCLLHISLSLFAMQ